jgi:hypothetical protein
MLARLFSKPKSMVLEGERILPILNPDEEVVRDLIVALDIGGTSFVSLTDERGNYLQIAGNRPWCRVEQRNIAPFSHARAHQDTPTPKYKDGAKLRTGAGDIKMMHDEWFLLKDAAEIAVAFLKREPFPASIQWRSMNEMFAR